MQKCLIIGDDNLFAVDVKMKAEEIGLTVVDILDKTDLIADLISTHNIDILIIDTKFESDIFINNITKKRENPPSIVFVTKISAEDVILKSEPSKRFKDEAFENTVENVLALKDRVLESNEDNNNFLMVKSKGDLVKVYKKDILFVKSEGNYCIIHTNEIQHIIRSSIAKIEQIINLPHCFQVHRAFLVNAEQITSISLSSNEITLGEKVIPLGRKYKKTLKGKVSTI